MELTADQILQNKRLINLNMQQQKSKMKHREKKTERNQQRNSIFQDNIKYNIRYNSNSRKRKGKTEKKYLKIMSEKFPNMMKTINPQLQEA